MSDIIQNMPARYIIITDAVSKLPKGATVVRIVQPLTGECTVDRTTRRVTFVVAAIVIATVDADEAPVSAADIWVIAKTSNVCCDITGGFCEVEENPACMRWMRTIIGSAQVAVAVSFVVDESMLRMMSSIRAASINLDVANSPLRTALIRSMTAAASCLILSGADTSCVCVILADTYAASKRDYLLRMKTRMEALPLDKIKSLRGFV